MHVFVPTHIALPVVVKHYRATRRFVVWLVVVCVCAVAVIVVVGSTTSCTSVFVVPNNNVLHNLHIGRAMPIYMYALRRYTLNNTLIVQGGATLRVRRRHRYLHIEIMRRVGTNVHSSWARPSARAFVCTIRYISNRVSRTSERRRCRRTTHSLTCVYPGQSFSHCGARDDVLIAGGIGG